MSSSIDALPLAPVANDFHPTPEPDVPDTDPDAIPELTFYPTTDDADRTAALKLVADSIAQQRQTASRALLSHPLHIALFVAVCSLLGRWLFLLRGELGVALSTVGGLTMGVLVVIRWAVAPYIELAEGVHPELLEGKEVVIAKYGQEVIGAAVWGWMDEGKKKKGRKAEVVAWTVRLKYRGKGIGVGLLETVVDEVRGKGGEGVGMVEGGIYSKRVLWNVYNGVFERREERAKRALQATWEARAGGNTRRKR
ncbi:hypothetical protein K461DRAFT_327896 [Myriangium duriaei CBS 260.36]|uniref:N-acetyltransferase domain-containing protein n=1 Tax=Myriangium duriaei CBS 260.36 TaxID=1168546 RepID=A0A9P4J0X3_9PEZI|nr:hypothetical protein K461DRAFT_327896 [Myriangium duriaei CBS 260.36]